uniref:Uncharacterized protein n=1 Tax=Laticauda laticaudata TaxID=8630 RepID=A0A8C5S4W4_LATLA
MTLGYGCSTTEKATCVLGGKTHPSKPSRTGQSAWRNNIANILSTESTSMANRHWGRTLLTTGA